MDTVIIIAVLGVLAAFFPALEKFQSWMITRAKNKEGERQRILEEQRVEEEKELNRLLQKQKEAEAELFLKAQIKGLQDKALIRLELEHLKHEILAPRVSLFYSTNGGGLPHGHGPIFVTLLDEVQDADVRSLRDLVVGIRTDKQYNEMLLKLSQGFFVVVETSKLPDCMLKGYYEADNVEYSIIFPVAAYPDRFLFGSAAYREDKTEACEGIKMFLRARSTNIARITNGLTLEGNDEMD